MSEIIPVDKQFRRKMILFVVLFAITILMASFLIMSYVERIKVLSGQDPMLAVQKFVELVKMVLITNATILTLFALYVFFVILKSLKSGKFPPPGTKVIRETKVQKGWKSKAICLILAICASGLMGISHFMWWHFPPKIEKMLIKK